jgi:D-beta-D-heptose 7-phosphate kinase/D-beta-D-heptose 1-phosphate adenosyltransferase
MSRSKSVLVVGDVMVDRWIEGPMTRISPEAPSPVILEEAVTHQPGGAANVAANIAALGNPTLLCGVVGDDWEGRWLQTALSSRGVTSNLIAHESAPTTCKARITCGGQQVIRVDRERPPDTYAECINRVTAAVQAALQQAHSLNLGLVVISDYAKGALDQEFVERLLMSARSLEIPVLVDTKPCNIAWYRGASLLKPNFKEASQMCDALVHPGLWIGDNDDQAMIMARHLHNQWGFGTVIITRGAHGATAYDGQQHYNQDVDAKEVYDVTGAGDTFMAVLADSVLRERALPEAMKLAATAATLAVQHHQTFVLTRSVLDDEVLRRDGKVVQWRDASRYIERQQEAEKIVVMTNGRYRFLHHGHIETFRWAKRQGDFLVVAVNSDASLRALGDTVFMPEAYRAELIAQRKCVDMVVLFDDPSVESTVRELKPDILVKGAQYEDQAVPGADFVARRGGEVRFAPMIEGVSVTSLAERR